MANSTKILSPNTIAFHCLEPEVAVLIIDIIHAAYAILGWRQSSKSLLAEILSRLAETDNFENSHIEFSAALWPDQDENRRAEKMSRWVKKLKEDMELSKFQAVWIENRRVKRTDGGGFQGLPTLYKRADFWKLFRIVQEYSKECDLMALPVRMRRISIRAVANHWFEEIGAVKIIREKKVPTEKSEKEQKEKADSPPCKCDCANCKKCASKPIAALESEPVLSVQIQRERERLREIEEEFVQIGQAMLNRGGKLSVADSKINAIATAARARLKAAVNHQSGRNDYAPQAGERAKGRAGLDAAIEGLSEALRAANQMEHYADVETLREMRTKIQMLTMFRNGSNLKLMGGQPK